MIMEQAQPSYIVIEAQVLHAGPRVRHEYTTSVSSLNLYQPLDSEGMAVRDTVPAYFLVGEADNTKHSFPGGGEHGECGEEQESRTRRLRVAEGQVRGRSCLSSVLSEGRENRILVKGQLDAGTRVGSTGKIFPNGHYAHSQA